MGHVEQAIADYSDVLRHEPRHVKAAYARAACQNRKGNFAEANRAHRPFVPSPKSIAITSRVSVLVAADGLNLVPEVSVRLHACAATARHAKLAIATSDVFDSSMGSAEDYDRALKMDAEQTSSSKQRPAAVVRPRAEPGQLQALQRRPDRAAQPAASRQPEQDSSAAAPDMASAVRGQNAAHAQQPEGCQNSSLNQHSHGEHVQSSGKAAQQARQADHASQQAAAEKHYAQGYKLRKAVCSLQTVSVHAHRTSHVAIEDVKCEHACFQVCFADCFVHAAMRRQAMSITCRVSMMQRPQHTAKLWRLTHSISRHFSTGALYMTVWATTMPRLQTTQLPSSCSLTTALHTTIVASHMIAMALCKRQSQTSQLQYS